MPTIKLETKIFSTIEICFDLSRSIELHKISTVKTKEKAIAGKVSGLLELNETVTWQATHFGVLQTLETKITSFEKPYFFTDVQIKGIFKSFSHSHFFEQKNDFVLMKDVFEFQSPFGVLGKVFTYFVLTNYMKNFLIERNTVIKQNAYR